jgi:hypothetical protein
VKIAVDDAEGHLADLVRRARNRDELATSDGGSVVSLEPLHTVRDPVVRAAIIDRICAAAAAKVLPGPSAARSQDFLYDDETGLPA